MNEGEIYLRFLAKQPIKLLAIQIINCSELIFKTISWIQVRTVIRSLLSPNFKGQELTLWLFSVETWHPRIPEVLVRTTRSLPGCGLARFLTNLCPRSHAVAPFISHGLQHLQFLVTLLAVIFYLELLLTSLCSVFPVSRARPVLPYRHCIT